MLECSDTHKKCRNLNSQLDHLKKERPGMSNAVKNIKIDSCLSDNH